MVEDARIEAIFGKGTPDGLRIVRRHFMSRYKHNAIGCNRYRTMREGRVKRNKYVA